MSSSIRKSLHHLGGELQVFGSQLTSEVQELQRNVNGRPVTGATLYRHCLEDLSSRLASVSEDVASLEAVSLDAISLEELVGHCVALYKQNHDAIAALEARLQSYGYRDVYSPLPPHNPLELMQLRPTGQVPHRRHVGDTPDHAGGDPTCSPSTGGIPDPPTRTRGQPPGTALRPRTAAEAMAPMTAAKARARHDTPSSLSSASPAVLSPSMRELLGKYASSSSSAGVSGLSGLLSRSARKGATPRPRPSASPAPILSPAFRAAAEHHREQLDAAGPLPSSLPTPRGALPPLPGSIPQSDAHLAEDAAMPSEHFRQRYQQHTERQPPPPAPAQPPMDGDCDCDGEDKFYDAVPVGYEQEEESTMELKAQVIFNRAAAECRLAAATAAANAATPAGPEGGGRGGAGVTPSTQALLHRALGGTAAPPSSSGAGIARSREGLQEAIAVALARTTGASAPSTTAAGAGTGATASGLSSSATPATAAPSCGPASARSAPSTRLTPSLATTVPPLTPVNEEDYSALPAFIRGQIPLQALNAAASAVHASAAERCAGGGGAAFSMDDVEGAGEMAAGKGKVLINALAKLGRVHLRVVYGQGTRYFFA